jgi:hypothetical protein
VPVPSVYVAELIIVETGNQQHLSPEIVNKLKLLSSVTTLPRLWIFLMCLVAIVAALDVTIADKGLQWHVSVGAVSLIAIGLIWLPTALRFLFLVGFSFRAAGVEATASGLLTPDDLIRDLANMKTTAEQVEQGAADPKSAGQVMDRAIDRMATRYVPADGALSEDILTRHARAYEEIRRTRPPGDDRTKAMNGLVNDVRIRAAAAPATARRYAAAFLPSAREGDRIVGLALVEGAPSADVFSDVLRIFTTSASAFEQYHSLRALEEIAPVLSPEQRSEAADALEREESDPRHIGVMMDRYIPSWIERVLKVMRSEADSLSS